MRAAKTAAERASRAKSEFLRRHIPGSVINDILDMAKVESGKVTLAEQTVHLVDPVRLKQMILNLVSNAVKFTPRGGRVSVSAALGGDGGACLTVAGTGLGLPIAKLLAEALAARWASRASPGAARG